MLSVLLSAATLIIEIKSPLVKKPTTKQTKIKYPLKTTLPSPQHTHIHLGLALACFYLT